MHHTKKEIDTPHEIQNNPILREHLEHKSLDEKIYKQELKYNINNKSFSSEEVTNL